MFTFEELLYVYACVEATKSQNTDQGRTKADVLRKACNELDRLKEEQDEKKKPEE